MSLLVEKDYDPQFSSKEVLESISVERTTSPVVGIVRGVPSKTSEKVVTYCRETEFSSEIHSTIVGI